MKENKGITLIALVITIIVLLILAGVSIAMLSGDNSIFKQASKSAVATTMSAAKEAVVRESYATISAYYEKAYVDNTLEGATSLQEAVTTAADRATSDGTTISVSGNEITITYNSDTTITSKATVDTNGKIGTWTDTNWSK